jgi:F-type H+-transporting ATPase subunit b
LFGIWLQNRQKNYFASRSQAIANDLKKVQEKLNESIALKKEALVRISEAEKFAEELLKSSKKENKIINDNIMNQCDFDLETLAKHSVSLMKFEHRSMVRNVVEDIIKETLSQTSESFDKVAMANILLKKVA